MTKPTPPPRTKAGQDGTPMMMKSHKVAPDLTNVQSSHLARAAGDAESGVLQAQVLFECAT